MPTPSELMTLGRRELEPRQGPQKQKSAVDYFGGNPVAWPGYGCHPSRFYPDAGGSWQRFKRTVLGDRLGVATSP